MKDFTLMARVAKRSDLRPTKTGGHLLKVELIDKDGSEIEAVFFNDAATHFDKEIQENKVYLFSGG
jgi:DNA polymerase III alpha subunit